MVYPFPRPFPGPSILKSFTVLSLFAAGEQGAWYDPSDFLPNWRLNLLTRTEEFDNAVWGKDVAGSATANTVVAPNGTTTADTLTDNATASQHRAYQTITVPSGAQATFSVYLKNGTRRYARVGLNNTDDAFVIADLQNGTLAAGTNTTGWVISGSSIMPVGNDWFLVSLTASKPATTTYYPLVATCNVSTTSLNGYSYTGNGSTIHVWGADLRLTSNASVSPTYQKITDGIQDYLTYQSQPVMFQDSAGTTPVTAVEQPVGLLLDKSKGLALGAELVTNGDFATDTIWSKGSGWTISGGAASCDGSVQFSQLSQTNVVGLLKWFKVSVTLVSKGASVTNIRIVMGGSFIGQIDVGAAGTYTGYFFNSGASTAFAIQTQAGTGAAFAVSIDNVTVKEIAGNHASQSTAASRPVLSARVNQLTFSEQFDNAAWSKTSCSVTSTTITDPLGGSTAEEITLDGGTTAKRLAQTVSGVTAQTTLSFVVKAGTHSFFQLLNDGDLEMYANFNASTGVVGNAGTRTAASRTDLGGGWYRLSATFTPGTFGTSFRIYAVDSNTAGYNANTASTGKFYIWGADLRVTNVGVNLPAYQRVGAATDYDTSGFPLYLKFDGVDDSLATGTIDPGSVDKAQVFAGVRKLSDAAVGMVVELSADRNTNNGALSLTAPSAAAANYGFGSKGTNDSFQSVTTYTAPITNVVAGIGDVANDGNIIRVNGAQVASSATDQGTGNYLAYQLYIGRRGGSSLPYNGNLYSMILRFSAANLSAAQIASTETYVNSKTKAY